MNPDNENSVDPTVQALVEMFPEDFLRNTARETGVVKRERKIDVVILFGVTTLGFGVRFLSIIRGLKRKYEGKTKTTLSISSFHDRFTPEIVDFLRNCVLHAIEFQAQQTDRVLDDKLKRFKDLVIQDSTIIRLHESLAKIWPATRTKKIAAGVKVSCVISAVVDSPKSVRIYPERTSEAKILRLGPWLRDRILLTDLGYFKYLFFDRIDGYGGYFVSRLKGNANPLIAGVNRNWRGNSIDVVGKKLRDIRPRLKREILDAEVVVQFKMRKYKGVLSKIHNIPLVKIHPEERLAATSGLNLASSLVTGCGEARGMGYWAATQVKGLSPEIFIVSEADVVLLTEGSTLIADSLNGAWQCDASPAGSETVARYQTDIMGTRETQSVLLMGVCAIKPIDGKIVQMTLRESDQSIVPLKRGNARGGKGLAVEPLGQGHIHRTKRRIKDGNKTGLITYRVNDREVLLKSRMSENFKSGSVRGLIAALGRKWL